MREESAVDAPGAVVGCLLGTAVGDAIGLPYEGLSHYRAARLLGPPDRYRFMLRRGMVSDDTEHACIVAQSLVASDDTEQFLRQLSWRLRLWLLGLPAGIGLATLRAILRLWFGVRPDRSGVFSAGNGPAMRAPILGAAIPHVATLRAYVRASARITHSDARAEHGACAVALASWMAARVDTVTPRGYLAQVGEHLGADAGELLGLLARTVDSVERGEETPTFAKALGLEDGVTGFVDHTVPIAIHAWLRHPRDLRSAVSSAVVCGGDADTVGAIVGGLVGTAVGKDGIPAEWLAGLWEWPRTVDWMERLGRQLATREEPRRPVSLAPWGLLARNLVFLGVVLVHGFRRLLPPY